MFAGSYQRLIIREIFDRRQTTVDASTKWYKYWHTFAYLGQFIAAFPQMTQYPYDDCGSAIHCWRRTSSARTHALATKINVILNYQTSYATN